MLKHSICEYTSYNPSLIINIYINLKSYLEEFVFQYLK